MIVEMYKKYDTSGILCRESEDDLEVYDPKSNDGLSLPNLYH